MPSKNGMAPLIEQRTFTGVMDQDSDLRAIAPSNYIKLFAGTNNIVTDRGTVCNVPSNVEITFQMFNGENKIIGAIEDLRDSSIVFYNYNSFGYHGIYRWYRNKQGYVNGVIEQVKIVRDPTVYNPYHPNPFNFQKTAENRITGAWSVDNLNFFTDYFNRSKFIALLRANETGKRRKFNLYFNRSSFGIATQYVITLWQGGNAVFLGQWTYSSSGATPKDQTADFIAFYQSSIGANPMSNYFAADSCDNNFPQLTMNSEGEYYIQVTATAGTPIEQPVMVPDNFYPDHNAAVPSYDPFSDDLIDRLCYTEIKMPTAVYDTDVSRETNFVRNKVYQFRTIYKYFENSYSVYSAISTIPIPQHACDPNNFGNTGNLIRIDFTDKRLQNPALVSIIKSVEIAMLEPVLGSTWVTIKRLDPYEFAGVGMQNYDFYNDQTTEPIDVKTTDKPYESLFIRHKSDEYVDDRGFAGGGIEGYDTPCIDANVFIDYLPPTEIQGRYKITGRLGIQNTWFDGDGFPAFQQQIVWKANTIDPVAVWGGLGDHVPATLPTIGNPNNYQQRTPTSGFVVYLAGTNYFTIAKHPQFNIPNLLQDSNGVFILLSTSSSLTVVRDYLHSQQVLQKIIPLEFTIPNVPPGRYILRVASHLTAASDLGVAGFDYQKTSTNVGIYQAGTLMDIHEQEIVITNADVIAPDDFIIIDQCDPQGNASAICAYLTGQEFSGDPTPITPVGFLNNPRIDLGKIRIEDENNTPYDIANIADHNGYVYTGLIGHDINSLLLIKSSIYTASPAASIDILSAANPFGPIVAGTGRIGAFYTDDANIRDNARTHIIAVILDCSTQEPVSGLTVVNTRGGWTHTGDNGAYSIIAYAPVSFPTVTPRVDAIILSSSGTICQFSFSLSDKAPYTALISDTAYNNITSFSIPQIICANIVYLNQSISKWKRGSDRFLGIVYGDEGDRKTSVAVIDEQVHITFYTEIDYSVSPPVLRPRGAADLRVNINNEPPDWATKFWIVASLNQQHSSHLVWIANLVDYVDANDVPVTQQNALRVRIGLQNIGFYTDQQNPEAIINYTFIKGDRIRFILDANNNYYNTYLDYEIIKATATDIYIEVDSTVTFQQGCVFELYTPRGKDQTRIFYEIGHCGLIKDAIINGVLKKFHEGNYPTLAQPNPDQQYGTFPAAINLPAQIKLPWGDVYYRTRNVPFGYDPTTTPPTPPAFKIINITDDSISDFYDSKANGWGRPNTDAVEQGQTDRRSTMRFSNRYISGTLINGLRNFEALNEKQFSTEYGLITKLILVDATVLKTLFSNSFCISNYINQGILRTATGATLISISDDVISNTHLMQRRFGTMNPESVVLNDEGDLFWWDENLGTVARSSGNALDAVSDYFMNSAFTDIANQRVALGRNNSEAPGVYDKNRDLYILSFRSMDPKEEVKSSVVIEAFDCDPVPVDPIFVQIRIRPLNITLMSVIINGDPDYPDISKIIIKYVNAFGNGWSASANEFGNAVIYSPDGTSIYYNQAAVLTYNVGGIRKDFTYIFVNGSPAGTGTPYTGETLAFCKGKKGWTEYHPYVPECYGMLRMEYVSFLNGKLWLHGDISQYNNFYGVQYTRKLTVPFNKDWTKVKIITHLELNTNFQPFCPNISVPPNAQNPIGMNTELTKLHFKIVHGKYWADMTRDKLTPDQLMLPPLTVDNKWVNGRAMTGQVGIIEICNDTNELAPIIEAQLGYLFTEKS